MTLTVQDLRPYTSLLLARVVRRLSPELAVARLLDTNVSLLAVNGEDGRRVQVDRRVTVLDENLAAGFVHYRERRRVAWLSPDFEEPLDELNQLILACCWKRYAVLHLSEPGARAAVDRAFAPTGRRRDKPKFPADFQPFRPGLLNAAFLEHEPLRTLWLRGIHRRTPSKADSKVLTGLDLENALSPLADQTYFFTAARSFAHLSETEALAVGVKPRMSRLWAGPVADWEAFVARLAALLTHLEQFDKAKRTVAAPVGVLASPVEEKKDVHDAYDISVIAPEILADEPIANQEQLERAERWAYSSQFENFRCTKNEPSFSVEIILEGESRPVPIQSRCRREWHR